MSGFLIGDFILLSLGSSRVLDVRKCRTVDGADLILYPCKERSLDEGNRDGWNDNQVFFIDEQGSLIGKQSKSAVDIQDGQLVLDSLKPGKIYPKFSYVADTRHITVQLPASSASREGGQLYDSKIYVLTYYPKPNPRVAFADGSSLATALLPPYGSFVDHAAEETIEQQTPQDGEAEDDSLDWIRILKISGIESEDTVADAERLRRSWEVIPLRSA
ncbi:hypothetical protein FA15DRAFT_674894 [Coprinopsis marcescibilis]|uniref:Uncharacterized protein n=1 Tax=Coprinopsis marcescibilis TaxID=230819 RepID=A0A5C3KT19_COPMA|nr:hypothetical protein FA15DRAFT_674894 [Coprinopsis marcescibilis]